MIRLFLLGVSLILVACAPQTIRYSHLHRAETINTKPVAQDSVSTNTVIATKPQQKTDTVVKTHAVPKIDTVIKPKTLQDTSSHNTPSSVKPKIKPQTNSLRVLLKEKTKTQVLFAHGKTIIASDSLRLTLAPGSIHLSLTPQARLKVHAHGRSAIIPLPCTLSITNGKALFSLNDTKYRGTIVIKKKHSSQSFSVVNFVPVEEYLQGVLPLEMGYRTTNDLEALKAQAIAARTYALARVRNRTQEQYDLLPTVSDQVFGGFSVEYPLSNQAVQETQGLVIASNGNLVDAFYHSTCGGKTSAIHDAWNSSPQPSLQSRSDKQTNGSSWCSHAVSVSSWKETWTKDEFSRIVQKYSRETAGVPKLSGTIQKISIQERTDCGRVSDLVIQTNTGTYRYGKDKVRFVLRRPEKGFPILRSSRFSIHQKGNTIIATGSGYGHGIGMCQNGALGRSRNGETFREILSAYYTDIHFDQWNQLYKK